MAKSFYINTAAADPAQAFVQSKESPTAAALPQFRLGDLENVKIYLVDGKGSFDADSGSGSVTVKFGLGNKAAEPTSGTYTLTDGVDTTTPIAFDASASTLQTALNALNTNAGPFSDTVVVTGAFPDFKIKWDTVGAVAILAGGTGGNLLLPVSGIGFSEITTGDVSTREIQSVHFAQTPVVYQATWTPITNGWEATVSFATYELADFLGGAESADIWFEIEITDASGNRVTRSQAKTIVHGEVVSDQALQPVGLASYLTAAEARAAFAQNRSAATGLTGGGATKLDGIATASGAAAVGWLVAVEIADVVSFYELRAGTTAESSPDSIRPDDYATTTNEVFWQLLTVTSSIDIDSTEVLPTITAAGNQNVDIGAFSIYTATVTVTDTYDATPFTHTLTLPTGNAEQGDTIRLRLALPASVDAIIEVRNATAGGTLLTTFTPENNTDALNASGVYVYNGTAWEEIAAGWVD
jgi:hypothetical protein